MKKKIGYSPFMAKKKESCFFKPSTIEKNLLKKKKRQPNLIQVFYHFDFDFLSILKTLLLWPVEGE